MALKEQLGQLGVSKILPSSMSGAGIMRIGLWVLGSILVSAIIIAGIIFLFIILKYNKKAVIFQKVGNKIVPTKNSKACFERVGRAGDRMFFIKSLKRYTKDASIQMGQNTYWFFEREDGELINFGLQDLDELMKKAGAFYVDFDMRMHRLGIEKNLEQRHIKKSFWDKYGAMMMNILAFMVIVVCLVIFFWQLNKVMGSLKDLINAMNGYIEAYNNIVGKGATTLIWQTII
jgi:uncharacterized membrane protein